MWWMLKCKKSDRTAAFIGRIFTGSPQRSIPAARGCRGTPVRADPEMELDGYERKLGGSPKLRPEQDCDSICFPKITGLR